MNGLNPPVPEYSVPQSTAAVAATLAANPLATDQTARTVYIGNLNAQITEDVLEQFFSCCGVVARCVVCGDATATTRFGFVEYSQLDAATTSLGLDGTVLGDRAIKVSRAKGPILVGAPKVPPVTVTTLPSQSATTQVYDAAGGIVNPKLPNLRPEVLSRTVSVSNVDLGLSETDIREFFQLMGPISRVKMSKEKDEGKEFYSVLVEYHTASAATDAVARLDNAQLGDSKVAVEKAVVAIEGAAPTSAPLTGDPAPDAIARTVHVAGLDLQTPEHDLVSFFEQSCGPVNKSRKHIPPVGVAQTFAFLEFATLEAAQKALALNGSVFGANTLRIMPSKGPIYAPSQATAAQQAQLAAAAGLPLPQALGLSSAAQNQQQQILAQIAMQRARAGEPTSASDIPGLNPLALYSVRPYDPDADNDSDSGRERHRRRRDRDRDRDRDRRGSRRDRDRDRDRHGRRRERSRSRSPRDRSGRKRHRERSWSNDRVSWRDRDRDRDRRRRSRSRSRDRHRRSSRSHHRHGRSRSRSRSQDRDHARDRHRARSSSSDVPISATKSKSPSRRKSSSPTNADDVDIPIESLVESVVANAAAEQQERKKSDAAAPTPVEVDQGVDIDKEPGVEQDTVMAGTEAEPPQPTSSEPAEPTTGASPTAE